jgi:CHAT domain-containing protein
MRRNILLAVLVASGCGSLRSPEELYRESDTLRRRGLTQPAIEAADRGWRQWKSRPNTEWYWKFRLLAAELQFLQGAPERARELLEGGGGLPPAGELMARYLADLGQAKNNPALVEQALELSSRQNLRSIIPAIELKRAYLDGYTPRSDAFLRHGLAQAQAESDYYMQSAALLDLGHQRVLWSRFDEAIPYLERAEELAHRVGAVRIQARAEGHLGWCSYRLGDFDRALKSLTEASVLSRQVLDYKNLIGYLIDIGDIHYRRQYFGPALSYYRQAADLAKRLNNGALLVMTLNNQAATSLEIGDLPAAERFDKQADDLLAKSPDPESQLHSQLHSARIEAAKKRSGLAESAFRAVIESARRQRNPLVLWEAEAGLAGQLHAQGRETEADAAYRNALATIEEQWSILGEDRHKVTFLAQLIRFYGDYVDFLMSLGQADRAAAVADSSRARVLAEYLSREPDRNMAIRLAPAGHVLLSYWLGPGHSYLWVCGPRGMSHYVLPGEKSIENLVKQYRAAIERGHDPLELDNPAGRLLYQTLIEPARAAIPPGATVIVVPDGCLHGLNFETLLVDHPSPHYWIEDVTVAVAPALGLLQPSPRTISPGKLLFIGDPAQADADFGPLPHLKQEAEIVGRNFPKALTVLRGERANPPAYAAAKPHDYSMIHFAAHAVANAESPLNSAIILSRMNGEYKLYAEEVLRQPLQAELVTISACRSAGAKSYAGEGLVGFTWAFMQAGARNVVAGLWDADDEATAELMGDFYGNLAAGSSPATALRQAKLKLLHAKGMNQRPYYWGPFEVFTRELL